MENFVEWFLQTDEHMLQFAIEYGPWFYLILFLIIFSETGIVAAFFLPGDGLLFSVGVIAAMGILDVWLLIPILIVAAISGNFLNYFIGDKSGNFLVWKKKLIRHEHLEKASAFYQRHGGKALILGRFVPVIRTMVPFLAGMTKMDYKQFVINNIVGAMVWVIPIIFAGYLFGELPWIKENFTLIYLGLVAITLIPLFWGILSLILKKRNLVVGRTHV